MSFFLTEPLLCIFYCHQLTSDKNDVNDVTLPFFAKIKGACALWQTSFLACCQDQSLQTPKRRNQGFRAWCQWTHHYDHIRPLAAALLHLTLFILSVIQENGKFGRVEQKFNGLNWLHKILGAPNPSDSGMVKAAKEAAKRIFKRPTRNLRLLVKKFATSNLKSLRVPTIRRDEVYPLA